MSELNINESEKRGETIWVEIYDDWVSGWTGVVLNEKKA